MVLSKAIQNTVKHSAIVMRVSLKLVGYSMSGSSSSFGIVSGSTPATGFSSPDITDAARTCASSSFSEDGSSLGELASNESGRLDSLLFLSKKPISRVRLGKFWASKDAVFDV